MSAIHVLNLTGLKAHHPLGFLAACGTLRSVTLQGWTDASLSWSSAQGEEYLAVLHSKSLDADLSKATDALIDALAMQARAEAVKPAERVTWLNWADKIKGLDAFRKAAEGSFPQGPSAASKLATIEAFAALATDAADPADLGENLFDLTSGNQSLLKSLRNCAAGLASGVATDGAKALTNEQRKARDAFREALIGPWLYNDDGHSMGWDPSTQRLHALRNKVPEQDKANRSVRAAVFLASQALPLFPCYCSQGHARTTGFHRDKLGDDWFTWPVWESPMTLDTLRSLLAHPMDASLHDRGVAAVNRSRRAKTGGSQGDYRVLTQIQAVTFRRHGAGQHVS